MSGTNLRKSDALLRTAEKSDGNSSLERNSNHNAYCPRVKSARQVRSAANLKLRNSGFDNCDDKFRSEYKGMSLNEMAQLY